MFLPITVYKFEDSAGKATECNPPLKVRYKIEDISHYQYWTKGSIVYIKGSKYYVLESLEELDAIVLGGNPGVARVLYGKGT